MQAIETFLNDAAVQTIAVLAFPVVMIALRGILGTRQTPAMRRVTRQSHLYNK